MGSLDERVRELTKGYLPPGFEDFGRITGSRVPGVVSHRERRKELLIPVLDQYADDLDRAADEIGKFFDRLRQIGIRGLVAENTMDADFATLPQYRSTTSDDAEEPTDMASVQRQDGPSPVIASPSPEPASTAKGSR